MTIPATEYFTALSCLCLANDAIPEQVFLFSTSVMFVNWYSFQGFIPRTLNYIKIMLLML